jgi:hypothetical protein
MIIAALLAAVGLSVTAVAAVTAVEPPMEPAKGEASKEAAAGPVVIELFSSEGCSSCPPAEAFVNELSASAEAKSGSLIILSWQVDYWNNLGWKDPFASPEATRRQQNYARVMEIRSTPGAGVYTPQIVVDGTAAMVGSDRSSVRAAIEKAKGDARRVGVTASVLPRAAGEPIRVKTSVTDATGETVVVAALVENGLVSKVMRGENVSRTLKHERVVRASATGKAGEDTIQLTIPAGVVEANTSVVVFAQQGTAGAIVGAVECAVGETSRK